MIAIVIVLVLIVPWCRFLMFNVAHIRYYLLINTNIYNTIFDMKNIVGIKY